MPKVNLKDKNIIKIIKKATEELNLDKNPDSLSQAKKLLDDYKASRDGYLYLNDEIVRAYDELSNTINQYLLRQENFKKFEDINKKLIGINKQIKKIKTASHSSSNLKHRADSLLSQLYKLNSLTFFSPEKLQDLEENVTATELTLYLTQQQHNLNNLKTDDADRQKEIDEIKNQVDEKLKFLETLTPEKISENSRKILLISTEMAMKAPRLEKMIYTTQCENLAQQLNQLKELLEETKTNLSIQRYPDKENNKSWEFALTTIYNFLYPDEVIEKNIEANPQNHTAILKDAQTWLEHKIQGIVKTLDLIELKKKEESNPRIILNFLTETLKVNRLEDLTEAINDYKNRLGFMSAIYKDMSKIQSDNQSKPTGDIPHRRLRTHIPSEKFPLNAQSNNPPKPQPWVLAKNQNKYGAMPNLPDSAKEKLPDVPDLEKIKRTIEAVKKKVEDIYSDVNIMKQDITAMYTHASEDSSLEEREKILEKYLHDLSALEKTYSTFLEKIETAQKREESTNNSNRKTEEELIQLKQLAEFTSRLEQDITPYQTAANNALNLIIDGEQNALAAIFTKHLEDINTYQENDENISRARRDVLNALVKINKKEEKLDFQSRFENLTLLRKKADEISQLISSLPKKENFIHLIRDNLKKCSPDELNNIRNAALHVTLPSRNNNTDTKKFTKALNDNGMKEIIGQHPNIQLTVDDISQLIEPIQEALSNIPKIPPQRTPRRRVSSHRLALRDVSELEEIKRRIDAIKKKVEDIHSDVNIMTKIVIDMELSEDNSAKIKHFNNLLKLHESYNIFLPQIEIAEKITASFNNPDFKETERDVEQLKEFKKIILALEGNLTLHQQAVNEAKELEKLLVKQEYEISQLTNDLEPTSSASSTSSDSGEMENLDLLRQDLAQGHSVLLAQIKSQLEKCKHDQLQKISEVAKQQANENDYKEWQFEETLQAQGMKNLFIQGGPLTSQEIQPLIKRIEKAKTESKKKKNTSSDNKDAISEALRDTICNSLTECNPHQLQKIHDAATNAAKNKEQYIRGTFEEILSANGMGGVVPLLFPNPPLSYLTADEIEQLIPSITSIKEASSKQVQNNPASTPASSSSNSPQEQKPATKKDADKIFTRIRKIFHNTKIPKSEESKQLTAILKDLTNELKAISQQYKKFRTNVSAFVASAQESDKNIIQTFIDEHNSIQFKTKLEELTKKVKAVKKSANKKNLALEPGTIENLSKQIEGLKADLDKLNLSFSALQTTLTKPGPGIPGSKFNAGKNPMTKSSAPTPLDSMEMPDIDVTLDAKRKELFREISNSLNQCTPRQLQAILEAASSQAKTYKAGTFEAALVEKGGENIKGMIEQRYSGIHLTQEEITKLTTKLEKKVSELRSALMCAICDSLATCTDEQLQDILNKTSSQSNRYKLGTFEATLKKIIPDTIECFDKIYLFKEDVNGLVSEIKSEQSARSICKKLDKRSREQLNNILNIVTNVLNETYAAYHRTGEYTYRKGTIEEALKNNGMQDIIVPDAPLTPNGIRKVKSSINILLGINPDLHNNFSSEAFENSSDVGSDAGSDVDSKIATAPAASYSSSDSSSVISVSDDTSDDIEDENASAPPLPTNADDLHRELLKQLAHLMKIAENTKNRAARHTLLRIHRILSATASNYDLQQDAFPTIKKKIDEIFAPKMFEIFQNKALRKDETLKMVQAPLQTLTELRKLKNKATFTATSEVISLPNNKTYDAWLKEHTAPFSSGTTTEGYRMRAEASAPPTSMIKLNEVRINTHPTNPGNTDGFQFIEHFGPQRVPYSDLNYIPKPLQLDTMAKKLASTAEKFATENKYFQDILVNKNIATQPELEKLFKGILQTLREKRKEINHENIKKELRKNGIKDPDGHSLFTKKPIEKLTNLLVAKYEKTMTMKSPGGEKFPSEEILLIAMSQVRSYREYFGAEKAIIIEQAPSKEYAEAILLCGLLTKKTLGDTLRDEHYHLDRQPELFTKKRGKEFLKLIKKVPALKEAYLELKAERRVMQYHNKKTNNTMKP
ncbi:MAG: hypothetical protein EPO11_00500 [Gammaproteobacteria bacterium]|nr:MAG: hypothetical protein EPO11_00500 [Gammaproteobacteria bacterium]